MAFIEQGVSMLSSALRSMRPIQVNIQIMPAFTRQRRMLRGYEELKNEIESMEKKYDKNFRAVFDAIKEVSELELRPRRKMGFARVKSFTVKASDDALGKFDCWPDSR